jgi:hypothetical protein
MISVLFIKLIVSIALVLTLSAVAEHVSPKAAGLLAGYPAGAAITLFFIGMDISPEFAADSAVYTMMGLVATQVFIYCYFKSSLYFRKYSIVISSVLAIIGYFMVVWLLHHIWLNKFLAALIPLASIFVFVYLFRQIKNTIIRERVKLTPKMLFLRAFLAGFMILIIIGTANSVGSRWAGLFSAFPSTLFPLILIVHLTYDKAHVHTIIKNFPMGLGSLITYTLCVSIVFPTSGIYIGTVISLAAASIYLLVYRLVAVRFR